MITQVYFDKVKSFFNGDVDKTWDWFKTYNPRLCCSPLDMIKMGRVEKLMKFIDSRL
jgi:hypothetical protein